MISKIDSEGNVAWSKEYKTTGQKEQTFETDALQYADTLVVAKSIALNSQSLEDVNLLIINAKTGNVLKQLQFSLPHTNQEIVAIKPTADHGIIILANSRGQFDYSYQPLIIKLDRNFNIEWTKLFGNEANYAIHAKDIIQSKDEGFVICGWHEYYVAHRNYKVNAFLLKLDKQGSVLWNKSFHSLTGTTQYFSVCETADGK